MIETITSLTLQGISPQSLAGDRTLDIHISR
jgi:hypothetical protein